MEQNAFKICAFNKECEKVANTKLVRFIIKIFFAFQVWKQQKTASTWTLKGHLRVKITRDDRPLIFC